MQNVKLFGERVAVAEISEELDGSLVLPQSARKAYTLAKVLAVGDGIVNGVQMNICVSTGDHVFMQINTMQIYNSTYVINGKQMLICLQGDIIAKIDGVKVTYDKFSVIGTWVLLEPYEDDCDKSVIIVPETVEKPTWTRRYKVVQAGSCVKKCSVNDDVIIERSRGTEIELDKKKYIYIEQNFIYGKVQQ